MEKRTVQSVIQKLTEMVESKTLISPEEWVDAAGFLQILKFNEQDKRLALQIIAKKKFKEIRPQFKTKADAEIEWETTDEWADWQRQEKLMEDITEFGRIAKKEADIRADKWK